MDDDLSADDGLMIGGLNVLSRGPLANQPDLEIAGLMVSPARRYVSGPMGEATLEPLVMQMLLLLANDTGQVVERRTIFESLWGSAQVGDDSLNRLVAALRKALKQVAGATVIIETVPRTGYRFVDCRPISEPLGLEEPLSRRRLLIYGCGALGVATGAGALWRYHATFSSDARYDLLLEKADLNLRLDLASARELAIRQLEEAVALRPDHPAANGLLAYAHACTTILDPVSNPSAVVLKAQFYSKTALAESPGEPSARLANLLLQRSERDWIMVDGGLRSILRAHPDHILTITWLVALLQAAGMSRESWLLNERQIALDPLSPVPLHRRALKHWIFGRIEEADAASDQLLRLWPRHPLVWNTRFLILAFTGREQAALMLLQDERVRPQTIPSALLDQWRPTLEAFSAPTSARLSLAESVNLQAAQKSPAQAVYAIMALSYLNRLDAAYALAEGFLLDRGSLLMPRVTRRSRALPDSPAWRRTQWLFTPPIAPFRQDQRFAGFCEDLGLSDYWRYRGQSPDAGAGQNSD